MAIKTAGSAQASSSMPFICRRRPWQRFSLPCACLCLLSLVCDAEDSQPTRRAMQAASPAKTETANEAGEAEAAGDVVLHADQNGHFRGMLLINQLAMPFLIDTGATATTIPMKLAVAARLPFGQQVETSTAAGRSFDKLTLIESLKIGSLEIKHLEAHINQHVSEVLIGMNALKLFQVTLNGDTLTLTINPKLIKDSNTKNSPTVGISNPDGEDFSRNQADFAVARPITKSVTCDARQHCITRFENP